MSSKSQKWYDAMHLRKGRGTNQYTKARALGLPLPRVSRETRARHSERMKKDNPSFRKDVREKISKTCLKHSASGKWHTSLARNMHYFYKGIDLHGKWEYAYAQYLDRKNILWERCRHRFAYEYEGKVRYYTPDFYLLSLKKYVEIKGYKTDKDNAKWEQFPEELLVLRFDDLKNILSEYDDLNNLVIK